jgi:hypothetical protein
VYKTSLAGWPNSKIHFKIHLDNTTTSTMTDAKPEKIVEVQMKDEGEKDQWWTAFPEPKASVPEITGDDLYQMFDEMDIKPVPRSFLLVDVRRTDWEVCYPC